MASALSNRQNCTCARKTLQIQQGRTYGAGCVRQWFRTAEPLGERRYENRNTHIYTHTHNNLHFRRGSGGGTSLGEWKHNSKQQYTCGQGARLACRKSRDRLPPGYMSERFFRPNRSGYPYPVSSELENSGIRVAVGDCSVTERRRWRPPYQTGKTVHVHANTTNTTRTDARPKCVRQWFRTAEPLGEQR